MPSPPGRKQIKVKQRFLLLLCLIEGWLQCITLLRRRGEQVLPSGLRWLRDLRGGRIYKTMEARTLTCGDGGSRRKASAGLRCPPGGASQRPASGEKKFAYSVGDLTKMPTVAILAPIAKWAFAYPKWQPLLEIALPEKERSCDRDYLTGSHSRHRARVRKHSVAPPLPCLFLGPCSQSQSL